VQKIRVPQNSFQFGEVSDSLVMRTDTSVYTSSAQKIENMIVSAEGSARKRQGLKHIYDYSITYDASNPDQSHLFPFIFDNNEQYIISIEHAKVRCFRVVDADTVSLVATITADASSAALPFDKDYLHQYTTAQMGDVMFICHPLFAPRVLTRTSLTAFNISTFTFDNRSDFKKTYQPYSRFQGAGVTLTPAATTGTNVIVTTSSAYFDTTGSQSGGNYPDSLHVGVKLRYSGNEAQIVSVQSTTQAKVNISDTFSRRLTVNNPLRAHDGSQKVEVTMINHGLYVGGGTITLSDCDDVGGIAASNLNITTTITSIIDENTFTFNASAAATSSEDGGGFPTLTGAVLNRDWDEQSWSAKRGYPAAVAFHENRLVFAGTIAEPDSIYMSQIGEYFNFDAGEALDNEAIQLTAATGDVHEIRHLVSSRDLQVFAGTGELYVPTFLNQGITPTNAQIREQTPYGCAFATPQLIDGATVFSQASGRIIREYLFTDAEDAYASTAISTIASHLINTPKYIAVVHSGFGQPDSYALMSMTDGDAAVFTSNRAEKRASWTEFTTNGRFDSVVAIDDRLFVNIYDANNKLRLCEFKTDIGLDSYVYGAISTNSVTVSSAYANGTTVDVVATSGSQNDYLGEFTVAAGAVSLAAFSTAGYTHAYVGKKFTSKIISNPIDASGAAGPLTGSLRGITNVVVDMKDTRSIKVNTKPINIETSFTGKKEVRLIGYDRDPKVTIEQDNPLSMQVNGFITEVII
tara:strand:- start:3 stop:2246 length:2244 start_codon:yes stop_codon:yes gene_type:complete